MTYLGMVLQGTVSPRRCVRAVLGWDGAVGAVGFGFYG